MSDAPETVEKDGQQLSLTHAGVVRRRKRMRQRVQSAETTAPDSESQDLETIAAKHVARVDTPATPDVEFVNADGKDIPPPVESDPDKRDEMTFESAPEDETEDPDPPDPERDTSNRPMLKPNEGQPHNLADVMSLFDIGEQYYVRVERKEPKNYGGNPCDGLCVPIKRYMTEEEFAALYGMKRYELIVYGPKKRNNQFDAEGKPIPIALTKPISAIVTGRPPNMSVRIGVQQGNTMTDSVGPGQSNNADARIFEAKLQHNREMDERTERRRERMRQEARERRATEQREQVSTVESIRQMAQDSLTAQREALLTGQQLTGHRPGASAEETRWVTETLQKVQSEHEKVVNQLNSAHGAALERLHTAHREELARVSTQHHDDLARAETQYRNELSRMQTQMDEERRRADQLVREATERMNDRLRETQQRADKDVAEARQNATERIDAIRREGTERMDQLRRESEQRVADNVARQTDRFTDLKTSNDRDLRQNDAKWEMKIATERTSFEAQMAVKNHELEMLKEENARLREEANKPIHERVEEFKKTALALGMEEKGSGGGEAEPPDWKQTLMQMALTGVEKFPEIVRSASDALQKARQGGTPQQQQQFVQQAQQRMAQSAAQHPLAGQGLPFAVDDADDFRPMAQGPYVAPLPQPMPMPQYVAPPPMPAPPQPQPQPVQAAIPPPPQPSIPPVPQPSIPPPPAQSIPPSPSAPPAAAETEPADDPSVDPFILQYREPFEQAIAGGATPEEVATTLIERFGPAVVATALPLISARRIRLALDRNGMSQSILCRRDGQKFLRLVRAELENKLRG